MEEKIRVVLCEDALTHPRTIEIKNDLKPIQSIVNGYFECVFLDNGLILCCNEEGKINKMPPVRDLGWDVICGPFFITKSNENGEFTSLNDEEVKIAIEYCGKSLSDCAEYENLFHLYKKAGQL